jgi:hypothetical protein
MISIEEYLKIKTLRGSYLDLELDIIDEIIIFCLVIQVPFKRMCPEKYNQNIPTEMVRLSHGFRSPDELS